jgi:hypothetical protein
MEWNGMMEWNEMEWIKWNKWIKMDIPTKNKTKQRNRANEMLFVLSAITFFSFLASGNRIELRVEHGMRIFSRPPELFCCRLCYSEKLVCWPLLC